MNLTYRLTADIDVSGKMPKVESIFEKFKNLVGTTASHLWSPEENCEI